jgi:hypothetical protein
MALDHSCGSGRHALDVRGRDMYPTPPVAVEKLLEVETLSDTVWEIADGDGAIVRPLRERGHTVIASDIAHYDDFSLDFGVPTFSTRAR